MLNKILKIFLLLNILLVSDNVFAEPAKVNKMIINTTSINVPEGEKYPKLLKTFTNTGDYSLVNLNGNYGNNSFNTTASVVVFNHEYSGKIFQNAKIFLLKDSLNSSNYGFTIKIEPLYYSHGTRTFTGDYIRPNNSNNRWIYGPDQINSEYLFEASNIGANITIQIIALEEPKSSIVTIEPQTIANLDFKAIRGAIGDAKGSAPITINPFIINPSSNTCKITSSDVHTINMKSVKIENFPSIGSEVDGGDKTTIVLSCSKGVTRVKVGMSDITEVNNTSNQLKLDPRSTALGFAVTLYRDNGNIITYNPDPKTGNNTWELSPSTGSNNELNYNIPITAKYYRTGSVITAGSVHAKAKITFIYE